jgi:DNA modification methylase
VLNDGRADWSAAWKLFRGSIAYVWHGGLHAGTVADNLTSQGFAIRAQIVWAKERLVIGRGDFHWQHEPCWYAVRGKGNWLGDRKQTTLWSIASKDQDAATVHGTQKPVECMRRPMLNNSAPGDFVYEPFAGSGTTLIAAQTVRRVCLAVELSPAYVDVIIRRWEAFTGESAILTRDAAGGSRQPNGTTAPAPSFAEVVALRSADADPNACAQKAPSREAAAQRPSKLPRRKAA